VEIDWLFALPVASRGFKLDDEALRVGVGLRLGLDLCIPHQCQFGSQVVQQLMNFTVLFAEEPRAGWGGTTPSMSWSLESCASAANLVLKEPTALFRIDGKRPDGLTLVQIWPLVQFS